MQDLKRSTIEHLLALLEAYAESPSGKEAENKKANDEAWDDLLESRDSIL